VCFHGSNLVQTEGERLRISALARPENQNTCIYARDGDQERFSCLPVKYWLHADPAQEAEFLRVRVAGRRGMEPLLITREHLMYVCEDGDRSTWPSVKVIKAGELRVGDLVPALSADGKALVPSRVLNITRRFLTGVYAPVSEQGSILVNDILVSSFSSVKNEYLQSVFLDFVFGAGHALEGVVNPAWFPSVLSANHRQVPAIALWMLELVKSVISDAS